MAKDEKDQDKQDDARVAAILKRDAKGGSQGTDKNALKKIEDRTKKGT